MKSLKNYFVLVFYFMLVAIIIIPNVNARVYWAQDKDLYMTDTTLNINNSKILTTVYNITDLCSTSDGFALYTLIKKSSTEFYVGQLTFDNTTYYDNGYTFINSTINPKSFGCSSDGTFVWYSDGQQFYLSSNSGSDFIVSGVGGYNKYTCNRNMSLCIASNYGLSSYYLRQYISTNQGQNWTNTGIVSTYTYMITGQKPCSTSTIGISFGSDVSATYGLLYNGTSMVNIGSFGSLNLEDVICYQNNFISYNTAGTKRLLNTTIYPNNNTKVQNYVDVSLNGIAGNDNLTTIYVYNTTGLFKVNGISNLTLIKEVSNITAVDVTTNAYTIVSTINETISNDTIVYGLVNMSKQECYSRTSYCNDTYYNSVDNGFYCDVENVIPCSVGTVCLQQVYDIDIDKLYVYNPYNTCSETSTNWTTLKFRCGGYKIQSVTELAGYILARLNINCYEFGYYTLTTSVYCNNLDVWNYAQLYYNHSVHTWGECISIGCQNFCNAGEYECGGLSTSKKCVLQENGCYDWNLSTTCAGGYVCKEATGLCGLIVTDNTCDKNSDCPIGQECYNGGCATCTNCGNSAEDTIGGLSTATKYWIMIAIAFFVLVGMTIIMASFGDGLAGLLVGLVMSMVITLVLTILFKLSLLVPILYIIIGGAILAILIRRMFTS